MEPAVPPRWGALQLLHRPTNIAAPPMVEWQKKGQSAWRLYSCTTNRLRWKLLFITLVDVDPSCAKNDLATGSVDNFPDTQFTDDRNLPALAFSTRVLLSNLPFVSSMKIQPQTDADFGQTDFGHPYLTDFGQTDFGQNWCFSLLAYFFKNERTTRWKNKAWKNKHPKGAAPKGGAPKGGGPKISRFFSLSATVSLFLCLSGCLLVELWWCLKRRNPQMCTVGVLGLSCEAPAAPKPWFGGSGLNVGLSVSGVWALWVQKIWLKHKNWPQSVWPKSVKELAKVGLAKVGHDPTTLVICMEKVSWAPHTLAFLFF